LTAVAKEPEKVADGVWRLTGDIKNGMNVYFIEGDDGITQFDAGTRPMTKDVKRVGAELGGVKRVVLGHSHSDHRGTAPAIDAPVLCHPDERPFAERELGGIPDYWDMDKVDWWLSRRLYPFLHRRWDGGAVRIADTVEEGDEIAGFKVLHFPGHAPGLIGLWRESDRLMLSSDVIYMVDSIRLKALPEEEQPTVPHWIWNWDQDAAKESVRKLAALEPRTIWTGHEEALEGEPAEVRQRLERAAAQA
jgi:glyoxylase-like metal-dependent hydrolase (beta-lactamase superfamily II)